ncbi:putative phytochrome sensor protein [Syntrophobacter sp. SbD1]|nr:putative phytochrome sensor protein [Syntrophobacter sp. SbD1]
MRSIDYLTPFVEVSRILCDGAESKCLMGLIAGKVAKTLDLKGCFVKMKGLESDQMELLASCGLSEHFLFGKSDDTADWVCSRLPGKTICVPSLQNDEVTAEKELMMIEGIQAFAVLPIQVGHETVAMAALFSNDPHEFTVPELGFATALVSQGILSVVSKHHLDTLIEHERKYLLILQEISTTISATSNIGKVLGLVVSKITEILGVKGCIVRLLDPKTQNLYVARSHGLSREFLDKGPVDASKSMAANMAGEAVVIDDVFTDPRVQYPASCAEEGVRKILSVPLMVRGRFIGVLRIFTGERPSFTKNQINLVTAIAQQCAFAIENARIYQRLQYDYEQLLSDLGYEGSSN